MAVDEIGALASSKFRWMHCGMPDIQAGTMVSGEMDSEASGQAIRRSNVTSGMNLYWRSDTTWKSTSFDPRMKSFVYRPGIGVKGRSRVIRSLRMFGGDFLTRLPALKHRGGLAAAIGDWWEYPEVHRQ